MYVCIMRQCFGVGTSYGSWLGLTIPCLGVGCHRNRAEARREASCEDPEPSV
jgi:hypothetical protein